MEPLSVLIVEDEGITAESLSEVLKGIGYEIAGIAANALDAIDILQKEQTDIAILDINIQGEKDGLWLADFIQNKYKIPFIFLTAYEDERILNKAVNTKPGGYLVKPFTKTSINAALKVAVQNYGLRIEKPNEGEQEDTQSYKPVQLSDSIYIKNDYLFNKVVISDIILLKSNGHYVEIHTVNKKILVRSKLSDFSKALPTKDFVRVNRSYLVNVNCIDKFGPSSIFVKCKEIHLSKAYRKELSDRLKTI